MVFTAVFGGTFNPLHIGHYEILNSLENDSNVQKILLMPDRIPPHKGCEFLPDNADRIEMCRIAANDFSKAELCLIEFERQGKSYTYDTVLELKQKYPQEDFAFVCGGDMLACFDKWYKAEELMKLISFIVFKRADDTQEFFNSSVKKFTEMGMNIIVKNDKITPVSSTKIRNDFKNSKSLIPKKIYEFLLDRRVYDK